MAKSVNYPSKETINLAMKEKSPFRPTRVVPSIVLILIVAVLFGKFAVYDILSQVVKLQQESNTLATQITNYNELTKDYDKVLEEYTQRSNNWMTEEEKAQVDYKTLFPLLEATVLPYSDIESVTIQGNSLSLNLMNLSLQDASNIIQAVSKRDDVVSVSINTANREAPDLSTAKTGKAVLMIELTNGYEPVVVEGGLEGQTVDEAGAETSTGIFGN